MVPSVAPVASSYLSCISQHRSLAVKALMQEDPRRAEAEAAAMRASRLARATCAAEARAAGLGPKPVGPSARERAGR
jgi:hypothetical protein